MTTVTYIMVDHRETAFRSIDHGVLHFDPFQSAFNVPLRYVLASLTV